MSSHHIIREKQEPALLVLGLDNFTDELLGQLLEWSPTLVATAGIAEKLNAFGIKFDVLVGDNGNAEDLQSDIKHIPQGNNGAATAALKFLTDKNYPAVNVVTDELDLNLYLSYAAGINIVLFYDGKKIYPITTGFSKWKPAGELITIMSSVATLHSTGLEKQNENCYITTADGLISLQFDEPFIFIAEDIA